MNTDAGFIVGDRVFVAGYGWGHISYVKSSSCSVDFDDVMLYTKSVPKEFISFTEYTLQGHTRNRAIVYVKYIGKWGKFTDTASDDIVLSKLARIELVSAYPFETTDVRAYEKFTPLTQKELDVLGLKND